MTPIKLGPYMAGDAVEFEVDVTDQDDGDPSDLTAVTVHVKIANADNASRIVASTEPPLSNIDARIQDPETAGIVNVKIPSDVTIDLLGTYQWSCVVKDATNQEQRVSRGYVDFQARIPP